MCEIISHYTVKCEIYVKIFHFAFQAIFISSPHFIYVKASQNNAKNKPQNDAKNKPQNDAKKIQVEA